MITAEKYYQIYNATIDFVPLTEELLSKFNITPTELIELVQNHTLIKTKNNYELVSPHGILRYINRLMTNENNWPRLRNYLQKYLETSSYNSYFETKLIYLLCLQEDYSNAYIRLRILREHNKITDFLYYLSLNLLSSISNLGINKELYISKLKQVKDLTEVEEQIRKYALHNNFKEIHRQIMNSKKLKANPVYYEIVLPLTNKLWQIVTNRKNINATLLSQAKYQEILAIYQKPGVFKTMTYNEKLYLQVMTKLVAMLNTHLVPEITKTKEAQTVKEAINSNDFASSLAILDGKDSEIIKQTLLYQAIAIMVKTIKEVKKEKLKQEFYGELGEVYEEGIKILRSNSSEERQIIFELASQTPEVTAFNINIANEKRIVLRHQPENHNTIDVESKFEMANQAYARKEYYTFLNIYRSLFVLKKPKAFMYARMGLAYLHLQDIKNAITYLTVATSLSLKERNSKFNYQELLLRLKKEQSEQNYQEHVVFGIYDIAAQVSLGIPFEDVCFGFGLTKEDSQKVALIFAKNFYQNHQTNLGNIYFAKYRPRDYMEKLALEILKNSPEKVYKQSKLSLILKQND